MKSLLSLDNLAPRTAGKAKTVDSFAMPALDAPVKHKGKKLPIEEAFEDDIAAMKKDLAEEPNEIEVKDEGESWMVATRKRDSERMWNAMDPDYTVQLVFANHGDATAFIQKLGEVVYGFQYLDGYKIAQRLGVELERPAMREPQVNILAVWEDLALPVQEAPPDDDANPEGLTAPRAARIPKPTPEPKTTKAKGSGKKGR